MSKRHTILTNIVEGFEYEDYLDFCEENGIKPKGRHSDEFYDWCCEECELNYESDFENIENTEEYNVPVIISGTLGLWWGHPTIEPEEVDSVAEAITKCIGRDIDHIVVEYEDGVIYVKAMHHDGTNHFEIRAKEGKLPYLYNIV